MRKVFLPLTILSFFFFYSCKDQGGSTAGSNEFLDMTWKVIPNPMFSEGGLESLQFDGNMIRLIIEGGNVLREGTFTITDGKLSVDGVEYAQIVQPSKGRLSLLFKNPDTGKYDDSSRLEFYNLSETEVTLDAAALEAAVQASGWYFTREENKYPFTVSKAIDPNRESFQIVEIDGVHHLNLITPGQEPLYFPIVSLRDTDMTVLGFPNHSEENVLLRDDTFKF